MVDQENRETLWNLRCSINTNFSTFFWNTFSWLFDFGLFRFSGSVELFGREGRTHDMLHQINIGVNIYNIYRLIRNMQEGNQDKSIHRTPSWKTSINTTMVQTQTLCGIENQTETDPTTQYNTVQHSCHHLENHRNTKWDSCIFLLKSPTTVNSYTPSHRNLFTAQKKWTTQQATPLKVLRTTKWIKTLHFESFWEVFGRLCSLFWSILKA